MNSSATSLPRFLPQAVLVYALALGVGAVGLGPLTSYAHSQAASYANDAARQTASATALLELQTAQVLDPGNPSYRQQLADRYIAQGDLAQAAAVLGGTSSERVRKAQLLVKLGRSSDAITAVQGVPGDSAAIVRSQAYLEEGSGVAARAAVANLSSDPALIQQALVEAADNNASAVVALIPRADSPETQARLRSIESGGVPLAQQLYASGLYQSATRVLAPVPDSSAKEALQAHLWLSKLPLTHQDLLSAQSAATQGTRLDPASLSLHALLQDIDTQLGDASGAAIQQELIGQLQSGRI